MQLMTDRSYNAAAQLSQESGGPRDPLASLPADKRDQVLAVRGLLACGLLVHCLQSRLRVSYGVNRCVGVGAPQCPASPTMVARDGTAAHSIVIAEHSRLLQICRPRPVMAPLTGVPNCRKSCDCIASVSHYCTSNNPPACRSGTAKKRLAVPYRAADLPSDRSEFSKADVALIYTHLAYYGDGLSKQEFKAAVLMLLTRGPSEQAYHYNRWLAQGHASGSAAAGELCFKRQLEVGGRSAHHGLMNCHVWMQCVPSETQDMLCQSVDTKCKKGQPASCPLGGIWA